MRNSWTNQVNKELGNPSDELIAASPLPNPSELLVTTPLPAIQQNDAYAQLVDDMNTPPVPKEFRTLTMLEAARVQESVKEGE